MAARRLSPDELRLTPEQRAECERHLGLVRYFAALHGRDPHARDDYAQAGFFGLARAVQRYRPERGPFAPYARRFILKAIRAERHRRRTIRLPGGYVFAADHARVDAAARACSGVDVDPPDHRGATLLNLDAEDADAVRAAWARLPEIQRRALAGVLSGRPGREIGREIGCSHPHAQKLARLAIARLRAELAA